LPLHQQIQQFSDRLTATSPGSLQPCLRILPLFLLAGVHVMEDIPAEVALAQPTVTSKIEICSHLGSHPRLLELLRQQTVGIPATAWIVLAHGSRRSQANQPIADLAAGLGAVPAFWAIPPQLESQVQFLVAQGKRQIGILPYFLFPGGITDAIAAIVSNLQDQLPSVQLHLAPPLNASPELADLLVELAHPPC
jgi:sirohydrochlorin ferrochelatase